MKDTSTMAANGANGIPPVVDIEDISLSFGKKAVLKNLRWKLPAGQVVGLLGRNGAGKTTLIESMLGVREVDAGRVHLFGESVDALSDTARAKIGYVPQRSDLFGGFTVRDLLEYFKSFYPVWNDAKVEGLLSQWQIPTDQSIGLLSTGQQQRLSIIRALAHMPELLVLDEPVASLDPAARREFLRELVDQVLDHGTTVVFSTHILSDLERVAFNVAFMREGRIGLQAPLHELLETSSHLAGPEEQVLNLVAANDGEILHRWPTTDGWAQAIVKLSPDCEIHIPAVERRAVNLEELFMVLS